MNLGWGSKPVFVNRRLLVTYVQPYAVEYVAAQSAGWAPGP